MEAQEGSRFFVAEDICNHFHGKLGQTKLTKAITRFMCFCSCSEYITTGRTGKKKTEKVCFRTRWVFSLCLCFTGS